jgi:hypothetical protein
MNFVISDWQVGSHVVPLAETTEQAVRPTRRPVTWAHWRLSHEVIRDLQSRATFLTLDFIAQNLRERSWGRGITH